MKPLIKWPGGKSRELKYIQPHVPIDATKIISPFVGGGAFYFANEPEKAYINDIDEDLIDFYIYVQTQDREFFDLLDQILADWHLLENIARNKFELYLNKGRNIGIQKIGLKEYSISNGALISSQLQYNKFSDVVNGNMQLNFGDFVSNSIINKLKLTVKMQKSSGKAFETENHFAYFETALKSAYYTFIRDLHFKSSGAERIAYFYFLREFCFGSMFRFNSEGKFNIPYGGIHYNRKNITKKVSNLRSPTTKRLLNNTEISMADFEDFLNTVPQTKDSIVFFDPPYDTTFSDYSMNSFGRKDQIRLASSFENLGCRGLMVTKETEFINSIFTDDRGFRKQKFQKTYAYNMRGRNDRDTTHLIITNY